LIIINNDQELLGFRHISYYVKQRGQIIELHEIYEAKYKHPQAPEHAIITDIEEVLVSEYNIHSEDAAPLLLLKNALDNIDLVLKKSYNSYKNLDQLHGRIIR